MHHNLILIDPEADVPLLSGRVGWRVICRVIEQHGFSMANFSYHLIERGGIRRYSMVLRTSDRSAAARLSETLEAMDTVLEYRITPTGD